MGQILIYYDYLWFLKYFEEENNWNLPRAIEFLFQKEEALPLNKNSFCPITRKSMIDPVIDKEGNT